MEPERSGPAGMEARRCYSLIQWLCCITGCAMSLGISLSARSNIPRYAHTPCTRPLASMLAALMSVHTVATHDFLAELGCLVPVVSYPHTASSVFPPPYKAVPRKHPPRPRCLGPSPFPSPATKVRWAFPIPFPRGDQGASGLPHSLSPRPWSSPSMVLIPSPQPMPHHAAAAATTTAPARMCAQTRIATVTLLPCPRAHSPLTRDTANVGAECDHPHTLRL